MGTFAIHSKDSFMSDLIETLADLFSEAKRAHHQAFLETDGADPQWPRWYAAYLLDRLSAALGVSLTQDELASVLVMAEQERQASGPGADWPSDYARFLVKRYLQP